MRLIYALILGLLLAGAGEAAVNRTFTIKEPFGLAWGPDRVNYPVEFPKGEVTPAGVALTDVAGKPVAVQLSDITFWPDKKSVKTATLSFIVSLQPDEVGQWALAAGKKAVKQPKTDLTVTVKGGSVELATEKTGIRLPCGVKTFTSPANAGQLPAPIQGVRLKDGRWIGKGWWQTDRSCLGYRAEVVEKGPVFARVRLQYQFAEGTAYTGTVELSAGQDLAVVSEDFNLSQGEAYEMPEQPGKPGEKFQYVLPRFDPPERGMLWDWWGGTHGRVPSPNSYQFSFYDGLQPDSAEWVGRMYHKAANPGDGGLTYQADGRVISVTSFLQWSDDESLYFGAYNAKGPDEVAIIGLRPGQWIHPDLSPHPIRTLQQWTATNNMWIERRTNPDLYLRVPVCLGRRMYGIGVLQRGETTDAAGKKAVGSEIMLRHVRFGRQRLDEVKDWVLEYPEAAKYPRLFVEPGGMARLMARAKGNGVIDDGYNYQMRYLLRGDAASGKWLVDTLVTQMHDVCLTVATRDWDHNSYAMGMARFACMADVALGVPECTPEQAALIRKYAAAIAYNCLSADYMPPREAGYAWGTANMMESLRLRGALLNVCLLPNHPMGKSWRNFLAKYLLVNTQAKINEAGATLEIGGYGVMANEFATMPFLALSNTDTELDMKPVLDRLRAAAHNRLSYLTPYDPRGGFRVPAPIGDSPLIPEYSLPMLAAALRKTDPDLAAQLMWGVKAGGINMNGWSSALPGLLLDPDAPVKTPQLHSEHFAGSGFIMRNGFPSNEETFIAINAGSFALGHGHNDRGGFMLYAKGAPLMLDFAPQYVPNMGSAWLHNGLITFDQDETVRPCPGKGKAGCYYTGGDKVWQDHQVEPFTCLEPALDPEATDMLEAAGKATAFATFPTADYGAMTRHFGFVSRVPYMLSDAHKQFMAAGPSEGVWLKQPFEWTRRYVFVKSPDLAGPNYLVLRDDLSGNTELKPALNFWCLADKLEVTGQRAVYTGQHGVDLDLYVAEPAAFPYITHKAGHTTGRDFAPFYQKTFGKPFEETQTLLRIPQQPGGGYFVALVPRKHTDATPTFTTVNNQAIQVTFPDGRVDTIVLLNKPGDITIEGLALHGTAFVITKSGGKLTTTMLAPGTVKKGEKVLLVEAGSIVE